MAIDALKIVNDEDTISREKILTRVSTSSSKYLNGQAKNAMCRIVRNVPRKYEEREKGELS